MSRLCVCVWRADSHERSKLHTSDNDNLLFCIQINRSNPFYTIIWKKEYIYRIVSRGWFSRWCTVVANALTHYGPCENISRVSVSLIFSLSTFKLLPIPEEVCDKWTAVLNALMYAECSDCVDALVDTDRGVHRCDFSLRCLVAGGNAQPAFPPEIPHLGKYRGMHL